MSISYMKHDAGRALLARLLLLVLAALPATAQPGLDDCTQGYAKPPYVDPRSYNAMCMVETGIMNGTGLQWKHGSEEFGRDIKPIGDVDHDGIIDFIVSRNRCDTIFQYGIPTDPMREVPIELLLYRGVRGSLPAAIAGQRVGPSDLGSATDCLASGDWDADGYPDIATRIRLYGDTSNGNIDANYSISSLIIFWGSANGYSISDTTRLRCDADMWFGPRSALAADLDADGVDDLMVVGTGAGFSHGAVVKAPSSYIFRGHRNARWGHGPISATADWRWWQPPTFISQGATESITAIDHDADGVMDIVLYSNRSAGTGHTSVLYGRHGALPDTTDIQTIDLKLPNGHFSLFSDVTGDRVPELLLTCGTEQQIKVFIGLKGQRLLQQFGSGNDSAQPGNPEWWGRPWARVWLPNKIHPGWTAADHAIYDAGDAARDGIRDIWAVSQPFVIIYNTGIRLDSLVDALVYVPNANGVRSVVELGDIDGSGVPTIAVPYYATSIKFIKPDKIISPGGIFRQLPPGTGPAPTSVPGNVVSAEGSSPLTLTGTPNPATGEVLLTWAGADADAPVMVVIADPSGTEVFRTEIAPPATGIRWSPGGMARGAYLATIRADGQSASTTIVLR